MTKKEYQSKEKSFMISVGVGSIMSLVAMLIGTLVITLLIMNQTIDESAVGYGVMVATILSAVVGCIVSILVHRGKMMIISLCTSGAFFMLLLALTAMFFGGQYRGVLITLLVITGSGIGTALIAGQNLNRPKKYHKKAKL